jgi:hypothetical protein
MNQDGSPRQDPAQSGSTTRGIAASTQWHKAELAMKVAQHSFERWLVAGHEDTPLPSCPARLPHAHGPARGSARHRCAHRNFPC